MSTEKTTNSHEFDDLIKKERKFLEQEPDKKYVNAEYNGNIKIEGVGKDAEIITNDKGGKQSKTPMALHLVDPGFLFAWVNKSGVNGDVNTLTAIQDIARFMWSDDKDFIGSAISSIEEDKLQQLIRIAKVLQYGADRYEANNWRLIPQESHINHALIHLVAHLMGDKQDDHLDHALCRLMMAYATEKSEGFDYNKYIPQREDVHSAYIGNLDVKDFKPGAIYEVNNNHPDFRPIQKLQEGYDKFMCKYKYDCHYKEDNK